MSKLSGLDEGKRWENYRLANTRFPDVRTKELAEQLSLTDPQKGETIVEVGTGNGFLTFQLARKIGKTGKLITYDYQKSNIDFVTTNNKEKLPITAIHQDADYGFELADESVDKISSIATLHHYDNRSKGTGTKGREKAIREFYRMLKKGGKLIIGDVAHSTPAQRHFDSIDNPIDCAPVGHPHDFLTEKLAKELCTKAGFQNIQWKIKEVPWEFKSEEQAQEFLHTIHNAECSPKESFEHAKKTLKWRREGDKFYLEWQLFYLTAKK